MSARIYAVVDVDNNDVHLVRAKTQVSALAHVAKKAFAVGVATQDQLVAALRAPGGADIDDITTETQA